MYNLISMHVGLPLHLTISFATIIMWMIRAILICCHFQVNCDMDKHVEMVNTLAVQMKVIFMANITHHSKYTIVLLVANGYRLKAVMYDIIPSTENLFSIQYMVCMHETDCL